QHGQVGHGDVQRVAIGFGIDRDGAKTHGPRRPDDATGDLAAVGNQQGAKSAEWRGRWHHHILKMPKRVGSIGALDDADSPSPSTSRVSAGSITPSSHSRAVA